MYSFVCSPLFQNRSEGLGSSSEAKFGSAPLCGVVNRLGDATRCNFGRPTVVLYAQKSVAVEQE